MVGFWLKASRYSRSLRRHCELGVSFLDEPSKENYSEQTPFERVVDILRDFAIVVHNSRLSYERKDSEVNLL